MCTSGHGDGPMGTGAFPLRIRSGAACVSCLATSSLLAQYLRSGRALLDPTGLTCPIGWAIERSASPPTQFRRAPCTDPLVRCTVDRHVDGYSWRCPNTIALFERAISSFGFARRSGPSLAEHGALTNCAFGPDIGGDGYAHHTSHINKWWSISG
jgi:hypothetical protein